jgi:hypothetical protein
MALDVSDKLNYQIEQSIGPLALFEDALYAGILQEADTPARFDVLDLVQREESRDSDHHARSEGAC